MGRAAIAAGFVWGLAGDGSARVWFDPSVDVGARATNNVTFQGSGSDGESDVIGIVGVTFDVSQEGGEGGEDTFHFHYRPEWHRYQDFDELDHDEHYADLAWSTQIGRRQRFGAEAGYALTQTQGVPTTLDDPNLFLTERTDRQYGRVRLQFAREVSRVWSWQIAGDAEAFRFDAIEELTTLPVGLEDREEYAGEIGFSRWHSANLSIGARTRWERFEFEEGGSEDNVSVAATWDYGLARTMRLRAETGVFHNTGEAGMDDDDRWGVELNLELEREWPDRLLRLRLENGPSSGGALDGSAVESRLSMTYGSTYERRWTWALEPHAARRDPTEGDQETLHAVGARAQAGRWFGEHFQGNLVMDWFDQSDDNSVASAGLFFSWHPMNRREPRGSDGGVGRGTDRRRSRGDEEP